MTTLTRETLAPGMLVKDGPDLYTVSNLYEDYFTVRLTLPVPERTTVRKVPYEALAVLAPGTARDEARAQEAYQWPEPGSRGEVDGGR